MPGELIALGELVSGAHLDREPLAERVALEQAMRASLLCTLLGVEREEWVWPFRGNAANRSTRMLAGVFEPLGGIAHLGTLAGAADLDPMDPGPSHSVLPATLAACILGGSDDEVGSSVLAGVETAWRLRRSVTGARPGVGFHSPGVYGAIAAAAAGARMLHLSANASANAIAIALTRAAGLAINSAASMIGMTHFGWGAAHGLEAALLASHGWGASHDVEKALSSLFGASAIDTAAILEDGSPGAAAELVFKRYPCNIYLNTLVTMLDTVTQRPLDRVEVIMPWIPHLDCVAPRDIRQARNSAQAVAAIAGAGDTSYAAFSGPPGPWVPRPEVAKLLQQVMLLSEKSAPTRLNEAVIGVRAWRSGSLVLEASRPVREMGGWGVEHARELLGTDEAHESLEALYGSSLQQAFVYVNKRRLERLAADTKFGNPEMVFEDKRNFDVVVVGCGVAGLSAAVAAAEGGAKVAVVERTTYEERGGNTRYTEAYLRMKSETELSHDFESLLLDNSGYYIEPELVASTVLEYENWSPIVRALPFTDPELISTFIDAVPRAVAWLKKHGITYGEAGFYGLTPRPSPRIAINGGGLQLVETMTARAEKLGACFFYEMTARELAQTADGKVCGLVARQKDGSSVTFQGESIILACGGFQGNPELVVRYIGPKGRYLRPVARGGYSNKGEGIEMALRIGAAASGDYAEYHGQPVDPRSSASEALVMVYPYGVLLNREGRRFINEAPGTIDAHYEETVRTIADQKKGIAFAILDDKINRISNWKRTVRTDQPPETASDIRTLGRKLGFNGEMAEQTIQEYNAACRAGEFDPFTLDGLATTGIFPAKSNYAVPIDTGPFHAYPIISANTFTLGGLKVNSSAQVIDRDGRPIQGLYAAGETMGFYYGRYAGATSVLRGAVFGRLAGEHASAQAGKRKPD